MARRACGEQIKRGMNLFVSRWLGGAGSEMWIPRRTVDLSLPGGGLHGCEPLVIVVTRPPTWRVYVLNQLIMYSCVRMKFDGLELVP